MKIVPGRKVRELLKRDQQSPAEDDEESEIGRPRDRSTPAQQRGGEGGEQDRQRPHDGVGGGHGQHPVTVHQSEAVERIGADAGAGERPELPRQGEEFDRGPELYVEPERSADRADDPVEAEGHAVFLGDQIPTGVKPCGEHDEQKRGQCHEKDSLEDNGL